MISKIIILILKLIIALSNASAATKKATTTTTTLTTSQWVFDYYYDYGQTQGCFSNSFRNYLVVNSSASINSNLTDFKNFFIPFKVAKQVKSGNQCCSKCGSVGKYKSCVAFDYNVYTLECQMYQIVTHYEYYGDNNQYKYLISDAQAYFIYQYIKPQTGRYSGVLVTSLANQFIH